MTPAMRAVLFNNGITVRSGLVGRWAFDEGAGLVAADSSGNGNNGVLTNGPLWVPGQIKGALSFSPASSQYVHIPTLAGLPTGGADRSVMFWMYQRTSVNNSSGATVSFNASSGQSFILLFTPISGITYLFTDNLPANNNITISGSQIPTFNVWHHVAFTVSNVGNNYAYYLDASLAASGTFGTPINTNALTLDLGRRGDGTNGYIDAIQCDNRVYARALSASEIAQIYNAGLQGRA